MTCAGYAKDVSGGRERERTQKHWWPLIGNLEEEGLLFILSYFGTVSNCYQWEVLLFKKMHQYVDKCFPGITSSMWVNFFKLEENRVSVIPPSKELLLME